MMNVYPGINHLPDHFNILKKIKKSASSVNKIYLLNLEFSLIDLISNWMKLLKKTSIQPYNLLI